MSVCLITNDTVASDCQETLASLKTSCRKLFHERGSVLGEFVVAFSGLPDTAHALLAWLKGDMEPGDFPPRQRDENTWSRAIILTRKGERFVVEKEPVLLPVTAPWRTFGSGQDFAAAALDLGHLPGEAIQCANRLNVFCGMGVEGFTLTPEGFEYWSLD